jgi:NADPH:quinone reductase-like Zn-dependent oxidoreductase
MNGSMKAIRVHEYGGPERLVCEEMPVPVPQRGEVLVRVVAAGVGPWDALVRSGASGVAQKLPLTPGSDIAGIVERTVDYESPFHPGDEVFGVTNASFTGGYAQYARASVDMIAQKPYTLGFIEAASVPVVAVTAWQMLFEHARLAPGQRVLVLGGAGSVGSYAVQLARWAGARVIAVGDANDEVYVRSIGAETFIDRTEQIEDAVSPVDVVIDTVGGSAQERSFNVLNPGGTLVSSVSPPSEEKARKIDARVVFFIVCVTGGQLARIANLIDLGTLRTNVGTVLALDHAKRAHYMLEGRVRHALGKIVLRVCGESRKTSEAFK